MTKNAFQKTIWDYYHAHGRHTLPWRPPSLKLRRDKVTLDPYKILVSEIMLQQTQVSRVIVKYKSFLKKFPTVQKLAVASLSDVLLEWQGLGYNRRGMYLKKCAEEIVHTYNGKFPKDLKSLITLPGIGPATAGDIMAFAWNMPAVVIETNIRSVFIHFFFQGQTAVQDRDILPLIEKTLDRENPREWYYALMDYGAYVKETSNPNLRSSHHVRQSRFEGSNRQKRSAILKLILEKPRTDKEIIKLTKYNPQIVIKNLKDLEKEKMLVKKYSKYTVI
jgi:A/G-specific adenine glycosylase